MSDISLQYYLEQVDSMIQDNSFDEAVYHCNHILHHFPRNIAAYRALAKSLMGQNQWEAAGEALLRILSVVPDDEMAHYGLSQVYRRLKNPEAAIWHLERAYEQEPSNKQFTNDLRGLYFEHRGLENPRMQLSTGAVAQQYARNKLFEQAVDVLVTALEDMPERIDLRLLLARIQLEAGAEFDAAEIALDVLERLPDCLVANVMMAQLWLYEERPSDAQRFLSRIEPLDPYLAMEIATGQEADEDLFELPEGDYETAARRKITQAQPDWLSEIDDTGDIDYAGDVIAAAVRATSDEIPAVAPVDAPVPASDDDFDDLFDDDDEVFEDEEVAVADDSLDWMADLGGVDDMFDDEPAPAKPPTGSRSGGGLTGLLSVLGGSEEEAESEELEDEPELAAADFQDIDDLFGDDDEQVAVAEDDLAAADEDAEALAWMHDDAEEEEEVAPAASRDPSDPLAWMQASGIELVDEPEGEVFDPYAIEDDGGELQDPETVDSLGWLKGSGIEVVEDVSDRDPLAWMEGGDTDLEEEVEVAEEAEPVMEEDAEQTPLDWLDDDSLLEEMLSMEELTGAPPPAATPDAGANVPDLFGDADDDDLMAAPPADDFLEETDDEEDDLRAAAIQDDFAPEEDIADLFGDDMDDDDDDPPDLFGDDE